jgi:hypothetical protein
MNNNDLPSIDFLGVSASPRYLFRSSLRQVFGLRRQDQLHRDNVVAVASRSCCRNSSRPTLAKTQA